MSPPPDREFDIIVFGSTGDAGRAIAAYLARVAPAALKWAVAGRSASKLDSLRTSIKQTSTHASFETIVATVDGENGGLVAMAQRARVVITAAGPYAQLGEPVLRACIEAGTHYVDITGEVPWVAAMREKFGARARTAGVCCCSFCGYDCVPAEVSVFEASRELKSALTSAECVFELSGGGMPRGTLLTVLSSLSVKETVGLMAYLPAAERLSTCLSLVLWLLPRWSPHVQAFTVPHFMGWCNTPVIHDSCAALGSGGLRYRDKMLISRDALTLYGLLPVVLSYTMLLLLPPVALLLALLPPLRRAVVRTLESSYSYAGKEDASVAVHTRATAAGAAANVSFVCPGDAGIHCTALLASETARAMLGRGSELPAGLMSPVVALGEALPMQLRAAGVLLTTNRRELP